MEGLSEVGVVAYTWGPQSSRGRGGGEGQECQEFKVIISYIVSLRPASATGDPAPADVSLLLLPQRVGVIGIVSDKIFLETPCRWWTLRHQDLKQRLGDSK